MIIDKILALNIGFIHTFAYWIIFFATFLESFPVFGLFIPSTLTIFIGGFLARFTVINIPVLDFWHVLFYATLGSILGGTGAYFFGRFAGKNFLHHYGKFFLIKREYMELAGDIICNHTGKSLILGKLNPVTRSSAPFIVGANKVKFGKFMFFNILGAIIWGFLFIALGYTFGHSYTFAQKFENWFILVTVLVIVVIYIVYFVKLFFERRKIKKITKVGECVANWPG